ncbi:MAG: outer membrane lipoprotein-sorting protein [Verrucomicrobiota bacterium]|jgi:hypothetical protein|nr:outer membrane lipoprotein-sorting protein [Verrucomicrobiota bacterium]
MRSFIIISVILFSILSLNAAKKIAPKPTFVPEDPVARKKMGADFAMQMRAMRPVKPVQAEGKLRIRDPRGKRREVPVQFRTFVAGKSLINIYQTLQGSLTVNQTLGQPTVYTIAPPPPIDPNKVRKLNGEQAMLSFEGSDFWMADLGLEFLHWPKQEIIKRELRRGELCSVLVSESANPKHGGYSKIVSWVDEDTRGIVHADIFDAKGKLMKVFSPKSFKKINGQWQLKEMEMRNEQTDTRTSIIFDLKATPEKDASLQK